MNLQAERVESLKAGVLAAGAIALTYLALTLIHTYAESQASTELLDQAGFANWRNWFSLGSTTLTGVLFGITYRYIIRQDTNLHLGSGAVLAFGLVRGLAQIDPLLWLASSPLDLTVRVGESVLLFAIARLLLDWSLRRGLVKRFESS